MTPVEQVLEAIRAIAKDEHDKGTRFENLMLHAFQTDRTFRQQFSQVWMWMDWPDRGSTDVGVDLVALNTDGTLTAIQCKCYAPTATLKKEEIDSFLATSGKELYTRRIIVATTDLWSANAEKDGPPRHPTPGGARRPEWPEMCRVGHATETGDVPHD